MKTDTAQTLDLSLSASSMTWQKQKLLMQISLECYFAFALVFGSYHFIYRFWELTYRNHPAYYLFHFGLASCLCLAYHSNIYQRHLKNWFQLSSIYNKSFSLMILSSVVVFYYLSSFWLSQNFPLGTQMSQSLPQKGYEFLFFTPSVVSVKLVEILFQQIVVIALTLKLYSLGYKKLRLIFIFAALFGILHLPMLIISGVYGLLFIIPSIFSSLVFPLLITQFRSGFIYSYVVHVLFYLLTGLGIRVFYF